MYSSGGNLCVEVTDQGRGITPERLAEIRKLWPPQAVMFENVQSSVESRTPSGTNGIRLTLTVLIRPTELVG